MSNKADTIHHPITLSLKAAATERNISIEEIAARTGLRESTIFRIFDLRYAPRLDTIIQIANAIGIEVTLKPE